MRAIFDADQRLVILRSLSETQGYSANDSILHDVLASFGHSLSRDAVRTHMRWLEEQGLLAIQKIGDRTLVASITERGVDVATGRARVDGVKRPSPGA
jgi:repressor of nif and glnA expression